MKNKKKIVVIVGTRPEAIKLGLLILELKKNKFDVVVVNSSQHTDLIQPVLDFYKIKATHNLALMRASQSSHYIASKVISELEKIFLLEKPDLAVVQGDTTTAISGALAAFYSRINVAHVEAGLRTHDNFSPFPEETNRKIISQIATLNFAPTSQNALNLEKEGIAKSSIFITGNTVIDSLNFILNKKIKKQTDLKFLAKYTNNLDLIFSNSSELSNEKIILLTTHRAENFGNPIKNIFKAIEQIVINNPDIRVIFPMHPNPNVISAAAKYLPSNERINIFSPLNYPDFIRLMNLSYLIMTDSGGIQEEAPALGKPVIVLRNSTERAEIEMLGNGIVTGTSTHSIIEATQKLLQNKNMYKKMAQIRYPFGQSGATEKIVRNISEFLNRKT